MMIALKLNVLCLNTAEYPQSTIVKIYWKKNDIANILNVNSIYVQYFDFHEY